MTLTDTARAPRGSRALQWLLATAAMLTAWLVSAADTPVRADQMVQALAWLRAKWMAHALAPEFTDIMAIALLALLLLVVALQLRSDDATDEQASAPVPPVEVHEDALLRENAKLRQRVADLEEWKRDILSKLSVGKMEFDAILSSWTTRHTEQQAQNTKLQAQNTKLQAQAQQLRNENSALKMQVDAQAKCMQGVEDGLTYAVHKLAKEQEASRLELAAARRRVAQLERAKPKPAKRYFDVHSAEKKIAKLQADLAKQTKQAARSSAAVHVAKEANRQLQEQIAKRQEEPKLDLLRMRACYGRALAALKTVQKEKQALLRHVQRDCIPADMGVSEREAIFEMISNMRAIMAAEKRATVAQAYPAPVALVG